MSNTPHARSISWLIAGDEGYGVRRGTLELISNLRKRGWRTPIITMIEGDFAQECRSMGFELFCPGLGRMPGLDGSLLRKAGQFLKQLKCERRMAGPIVQQLREWNVEGTFVRWPNLVGLAGRVSKTLGVPCFWHMPNIVGGGYPFDLNRRIVQRRCHRMGIQPIANSRYTAATIGDKPVKPMVMYLGVDADRFDPDRVESISRGELGIPEDAVTFGIVARLDESKGQARFLEALTTIDDHDPKPHLLLVGGAIDSEYGRRIQQIARDRGAVDRLHMTDNVPDPERYYGVMDVAVNARIDAEPFGMSVIEAMSMRRPILVHALGGPRESVVDGETGWHMSDPSVESFATAIRRALKDRPEWEVIGHRARQHVLEHFTFQHTADTFVQIAESVIAQRRPAAR